MTDWPNMQWTRDRQIGMRAFAIMIVFALSALWPLDHAAAQSSGKQAKPAGDRAQLSYALGYEAGLDLRRRQPDVDIATVVRGVRDGYARTKPAYSPQEMQQVLQQMQQEMVAKARAAYQKLAEENLHKAQAFFAHNKTRQGVVSLPSGVQYKVLDGGDGNKSPTIDSEVTLEYRGEFLDGTVFDNTEDRGKPVVFPVNQMIPGWRQIITRMHVGDHWQVFIPPDQAYGIRGEPPRIGPNEALVFDIRLLGIKP